MDIEPILERIETEQDKIADVPTKIRDNLFEIDIAMVNIRTKGNLTKFTNVISKHSNNLEQIIADAQDAQERLHGALKDLEQENEEPHCPHCGELETVRTAVDNEGDHKCSGGGV